MTPPRCPTCSGPPYPDDDGYRCLWCARLLAEYVSPLEAIRKAALAATVAHSRAHPTKRGRPPGTSGNNNWRLRPDLWQPEHNAMIRELYAQAVSADEIARLLTIKFGVERTDNSVRAQELKLGLRAPAMVFWSDAEIALLCQMTADRASIIAVSAAVSALCGVSRSPEACRAKATALGLSVAGLGWWQELKRIA